MKTKKYICENCKEEVTDSQKYCNHCGSLLDACGGKKKLKKKNLKDASEDFIGEESGESMDIDTEEVYNNLLEEYPEETPAFFGSLNEFEKMVEEITSEGEFSVAEAVDGLIQTFYEFVEDPEGFVEELNEEESEEEETDSVTDSISSNKKAGYVMDLLTQIPGISKGKAMAILAYHGGMKNLRGMKDTKELLKYKYLKNILSQEDANSILEYLTKKKKLNKAKVAELGYDSTKVKKNVCENCNTEVTDSQKFCTECGSKLL